MMSRDYFLGLWRRGDDGLTKESVTIAEPSVSPLLCAEGSFGKKEHSLGTERPGPWGSSKAFE